MAQPIMSWSECVVKIAPTGAADALGTPLVSVGTIKDKSTTLSSSDGDKLVAKATGGKSIAQMLNDGEISLTTRIVEPDFKAISSLVGQTVKAYAAALIAATSIQIVKGSKAWIGMYLSNGTQKAAVTNIDTSNGSYDVLTITLGAAVALAEELFESNSDGSVLVRSNVVPIAYSVEVTPKNVGANGIRARKCAVSYKEGWSEDEGSFADLTFIFMTCADGALYSKFKKA